MKRYLNFTFFFFLGASLLMSCGNEAKEKKAAETTTIAPEASSTSSPTTSAPTASKPSNSAGNKADQVVDNLPPTKTILPENQGKSRTYTLTLDENIRGTWRNYEDPKNMLVISENQWIRMYDGKMLEALTFSTFVDCPKECIGNEELERGTNCLKLSGEKGETCYLLLDLDRVKLRFRQAGSGTISAYKRM